jgi:signal transduction histidine kinase
MDRSPIRAFFLSQTHNASCLVLALMLAVILFGQNPHPLTVSYDFQDGLSSQTVYACTQDQAGYMWFATDDGVTRFDGTEFKRFSIEDGLCDNIILDIQEDGPRLWFIAQNDCRSYFENGIIVKSDSTVNANKSKESPSYSLSSSGVLLSNQADFESLLLKDAPDHRDAHSIEVFPDGSIWILSGTHGLWQYSDASTPPHFMFKGTIVLDVFLDRDENIWVCTKSKGVMILPHSGHMMARYRASTNDQSLCLAADPNGGVLVGTSAGMLIAFTGPEMQIQSYITRARGTNDVSQLLVDSVHDDLWMGGDFGLVRYHFQDGVWEPTPRILIQENVTALVQNGPDIVFATDQQIKIGTLNKDDFTIRDFLWTDHSCRCLFIDQRGTLWFEDGNLLKSKKDSVLITYPKLTPHFGTRITSISGADDGSLFVSTYGGGLHRIEYGVITATVDLNSGLLSNNCKDIFIDGKEHFIATDQGVSVFQWQESEPTFVSQYTEAQGLPSNDVHDVLVVDSLIYLATSDGTVIFKHGSTLESSKPPFLNIEGVSIGDNIASLNQDLILDFDHAPITFGYSGISFDPADFIEYAYRIGNNREWTTSKNRSLQFSNLDYGKYSVELKAKKHNSTWSETRLLDFTILPPYYSTWWFRSLIGLGLAAILFFIIRFNLQRKFEKKLAIHKQEQAVAEERNRISADMHDDLGSELANIVLLSRIAQASPGDSSQEPIQKIDKAATDVSKKMSEIIWALNPKNDSLPDLIRYMRRYVNDYLDLHDMSGRFNGPKATPDIPLKTTFRRNSFLILKECLQNVNKHADASRVDVSVHFGEDQFSLIICDNGKGFDQSNLSGFGNGLTNLKSRAEDMGGELKIESKATEGSTFTLRANLKDHT